MNEINDMFFRLAKSMDVLVCDITAAFAGQAMFDEFHLRESAEVRVVCMQDCSVDKPVLLRPPPSSLQPRAAWGS